MRATTAVASLLAVCLQVVCAATIPSQTRQEGIIYGCHFKGDGIATDISAGHDDGPDKPVTGASGKKYVLDCGTTSTPDIPNVFAKCTVDGDTPVISAYNGTFITCAFPKKH
ncbi:hypothetical protein DHEL01_v207716 [Diaporthe helianthi]|uniref:Uncharacterized protein n=1 Tax=Diaporthe helianthi TaxID=158607 RepID=A0A2P5HUG9_DIAHE|nr:hypothetical protein DHEL01_v207716 [Diaporthe helianthi]